MSLPISFLTPAKIFLTASELEFVKKYLKVKKQKHSLRCPVCGKFMSNDQATQWSPTDGVYEVCHIDCLP